jgi:hypothetical protein
MAVRCGPHPGDVYFSSLDTLAGEHLLHTRQLTVRSVLTERVKVERLAQLRRHFGVNLFTCQLQRLLSNSRCFVLRAQLTVPAFRLFVSSKSANVGAATCTTKHRTVEKMSQSKRAFADEAANDLVGVGVSKKGDHDVVVIEAKTTKTSSKKTKVQDDDDEEFVVAKATTPAKKKAKKVFGDDDDEFVDEAGGAISQRRSRRRRRTQSSMQLSSGSMC